MLGTPVALIVFNRPQLTRTVFAAIARAKPRKLLLVADGPRSSGEAEDCAQARAVADEVDWDCEVMTNFADENLGCRRRVSSGLEWVFSEVEEAIILEDDCLPAPSFFSFCENLLAAYRDDERVMHIGGANFQGGRSRTADSYYFSRYCHVWGWASWRRAWRNYDVEMKSWQENRELIRASFADQTERAFWTDIFDRTQAGQIDTWDYQWVYACWAQNGLAVIPDVNLVSNLGFGAGATHTHDPAAAEAGLPVADIWEVRHPRSVVRHHEADDYSFDHVFGGRRLREAESGPAPERGAARRLAGKVLRRFSHG
jgi:hypothetical protein